MVLGQHPLKISLRSALVVVVVLTLGFVGGLLYSDITNTQTNPSPNTIPPGTICNRPNIPVGENPAKLCQCQ